MTQLTTKSNHIGFFKAVLWALLLGIGLSSNAQEQVPKFSAELTGSFTHFEQQIKLSIGGVKGDLLAANTEFNLQAVGTYKLWEAISAGWYFQYDIGNREQAQLAGFLPSQAPAVTNVQGGTFQEFWSGPIIRAQHKQAFLEIGYGLIGTRTDESRADILNTSGSNQGSFSLDPSVAWIIGIGANVNLSNKLNFIVKANYRARYYNARDGDELDSQAVHGTQNFSPLIGLGYSL